MICKKQNIARLTNDQKVLFVIKLDHFAMSIEMTIFNNNVNKKVERIRNSWAH